MTYSILSFFNGTSSQVTAKKSINFYMNSAKAFFTGVVDKEGKTREPVMSSAISWGS